MFPGHGLLTSMTKLKAMLKLLALTVGPTIQRRIAVGRFKPILIIGDDFVF